MKTNHSFTGTFFFFLNFFILNSETNIRNVRDELQSLSVLPCVKTLHKYWQDSYLELQK